MANDDQRVVYLERDAAEELLDLVADRPGDADEDLLDDALEAIQEAGPGLSGEAQAAVARGDAVAVGLDPQEAATLSTLIRDNTEADPPALQSIASSMKAKLKAARKKARRKQS